MQRFHSLIALFLMLITASGLSAQNLVSTTPQPRNAVLEEFTGINCPNCPDGHVRAEALAAAHPGRVVLINVHTGSFANPSAGQPDFRTPYGPALDAFAGVAAYPSGTMNRVVWPGAYNIPPYYPQNPPNNLAIRRPGWWDVAYPGQGCGEYIILNGGLSPVNIGCSSMWNDLSRLLTITVELYYTSDDSVAENKLNVVLTENNVIGYQSGGSANYNHMHILREMITGQWGESVSPTTTGTLITRTFSYAVPATIVIENCDISVFVTRDNNKHTHTGIVIPAKDGSTVGLEEQPVASLTLNVNPNPGTAQSEISYSVRQTGEVCFELRDLSGKLLARTTDQASAGCIQQIALHRITGQRQLAPGMYLLSLQSGGAQKTIRFILE